MTRSVALTLTGDEKSSSGRAKCLSVLLVWVLLCLLHHLLGVVDWVERFCLAHQLDREGFVEDFASCRSTVLRHMLGLILDRAMRVDLIA